MEDRPFLSADQALTRALGPVAGLDVIDVGAGSGPITRALARLGARALGMEPSAEAVAAAAAAETAQATGARYAVAAAEATGLAGGSADVVVFSLSLHHVPDMGAAIAEAHRLLRSGGRLCVIEPEAPDPIWSVVRYVDDESAVYAAAQAAIDEAVRRGAVLRGQTLRHAAKYRSADAAAMLGDLTAVDPTRRLDPADRPAFEAAYAAALDHDADGAYIPYWLRLDVLTRP